MKTNLESTKIYISCCFLYTRTCIQRAFQQFGLYSLSEFQITCSWNLYNSIKWYKMLSFQQIKHCFIKLNTIWNICKQICIKFFQFVAILFNLLWLQFPTLCSHFLCLATVRNHKFDILSVYLCFQSNF